MDKNIIIELYGEVLSMALLLPEEKSAISRFFNSLQVREEGCYMKDYVIDGSGEIIQTDTQHIPGNDADQKQK